MPFDAVLFDFDGLILDTETPDYQSWCEVFEAHGCELPLAVWSQAVGVPPGAFDECGYLEAQLGRAIEREPIRRARTERFHALVREQSLRDGVLEALDTAARLGMRIGIASSADRAWIEGHLEHHGIRAHFAAIRSRDDVTHAKPDPEVYLAAAAALGVEPARTLVFEDSPNGIQAAKRAGMTCVAVPNSVTMHLDVSAADMVIASLGETTLTQLIEELGERG